MLRYKVHMQHCDIAIRYRIVISLLDKYNCDISIRYRVM